MKKDVVIYSLILCFAVLLSGCQLWTRKQQAGAVVEVNGQFLYRSTLDSLTLGLNREDSMRVAQQYISQWAKDMLMYEQVERQESRVERAEIESLVADYRRTLYVHAYENYLVETRMSKTILDTTIAQFYAQAPDRFRLDESIMKGLLLVVPNDAPNMKKLRQWLSAVTETSLAADNSSEIMDPIEKYAYQNANGYELFIDKWLTTSEMMTHIPIGRNDLETRLKQRNLIEVSDSTKTYLLQITSKYMRGEAMPIEFARPEIEKLILSARQVEFLQKERERLYNEAVQEKKIIFF